MTLVLRKPDNGLGTATATERWNKAQNSGLGSLSRTVEGVDAGKSYVLGVAQTTQSLDEDAMAALLAAIKSVVPQVLSLQRDKRVASDEVASDFTEYEVNANLDITMDYAPGKCGGKIRVAEGALFVTSLLLEMSEAVDDSALQAGLAAVVSAFPGLVISFDIAGQLFIPDVFQVISSTQKFHLRHVGPVVSEEPVE